MAARQPRHPRSVLVYIILAQLAACGSGASQDAAPGSDSRPGDGPLSRIDAPVDAVPQQCSAPSDCVAPPPGVCASPGIERQFLVQGRCEMNVCMYDSQERACPLGCGSGACRPGGDIVLVDGYPDLETWHLDQTGWHARVTANRPPLRQDMSSAFNPVTQRLVLFGGTWDSDFDDTWTYDGVNWSEVVVATRPPARYLAPMGFDLHRSLIVMGGGVNSMGGFPLDDWSFDGAAWQLIAAGENYSDAPMLFNGQYQMLEAYAWAGVRYRFNGTDWTLVATQAADPAPYTGSSVATVYDWNNHSVLTFGGVEGDYLDETWRLSGDTWTRLDLSPRPEPRFYSKMVFDSVNDRILLVGGANQQSYQLATWSFDGSSWTQLNLPNQPPVATHFVLEATTF